MQDSTSRSRSQHRTHPGLSVAMFRNRNSDPGHWLLRGIQSAIFYYISCTPCAEAQHKRRRRREARADHAKVVNTEPGFVRQPMAFETNEQWAEEILLGPGPPEGWKGDDIYRKFRKEGKKAGKLASPPSTPNTTPPPPPPMTTMTSTTMTMTMMTTATTTVTTTATAVVNDGDGAAKCLPDRRFSNALDNVKVSLKNSLLPERWNGKSRDREDEILVRISDKMNNAGDKMSRMWDRVTSAGHSEDSRRVRKRPSTVGSDYDYTRGKIPPINNLHPPIVSQLPATMEEAAWMLLPPPSAAVMAGMERPTEEMAYRVPLCIIGRPPRRARERDDIGRSEETSDVAADGLGSTSDLVWELDTQSDEEDEAEKKRRARHQSEPTLSRRALRSDPSAAADTVMQRLRRPEPTLFVPKHGSMSITLDGLGPDLFTKPEVPASGSVTPMSRPASWQFHYIIPST